MKFSLPKNFRLSRTWVVLGMALLVGLIAAFAAKSYLSSQMAKMQSKSKGQTVDVVVAKTNLKKNAVMSSDTLAVRSIPAEYAQSKAVSPADFEKINGRRLDVELKAGEMLMESFLQGRHALTFSATVQPGHRAITLPIDEINSMSGMLEPGDAIDLLVSFDRQGKKMVAPLLLGVKVMATGSRAVDDPKSGERRQYSTVTLDTSADEARNLIAAKEMGRITALLRNPKDPTPNPRQPMDLAALMQQRDNVVDIAERGIPVLYGSRSLSTQDTALARPTPPPEVAAVLRAQAASAIATPSDKPASGPAASASKP